MTSIFQDGALHPGRDPDDAWWIMVRRPEDWGPRPGAYDRDVRYDASRMVLELAPAPLAAGPVTSNEVTAPDGTSYLADPKTGRLLGRRRCDDAFAPLPGLGVFDEPRALALDDRGWLYVVDARDRVVVVEPNATPARIVIVLEVGGAVAVAAGRERIYVGTDAGAIVPFDRSFRRGAAFTVARPHHAGTRGPRIVALAVDAGELVVVADAAWSRLTRFRCDGEFVDEVGHSEAADGLLDELALARFADEGVCVIGPIDGGSDGFAWHHVAIDAELPEGTAIEVQTYAADPLPTLPPYDDPPPAPALPVTPPWAPAVPVAITHASIEHERELRRPVVSDWAVWEMWRHAPYARGSLWSHELAGAGPNAAATFNVPPAIARRMRAGDEIELRTASPVAAVSTPTIDSISPRAVGVIATGDRSTPYGGGAEVRLRERGGRSADGAVLHTLTLLEVIDLTSITSDGGADDVQLPHAVAALLEPGDVIDVVEAAGPREVTLVVERLAPDVATVTLATPVVDDFSTASLRLVDAPDRLVVAHARGWEAGIPPGREIAVERVTGGGVVVQDVLPVRWSDPLSATVWLASPPDASWRSFAPAHDAVATDRGRFLWVRLRLRGARRRPSDVAATATPVVRAVRVVGPRLSLLSLLPAVFSRRDQHDRSGALFLERFLAIFEGRLTDVERSYESIAYLLNPFAADDDWLDFVAGWFDLVLDRSWPRARRARLLSQIFELYRIRGTREGIARFVEAYTGHRPHLLEGFQVRPRPGLVLGCDAVLGCAPLGGLDTEGATREAFLASYAHRLTVVAYVDDACERDAAEARLRALLAAITPAHVDIDLRVAGANTRLAVDSTIGIDFVLGTDERLPQPLGTVLGHGTLLGTASARTELAETTPPAVGDFTVR